MQVTPEVFQKWLVREYHKSQLWVAVLHLPPVGLLDYLYSHGASWHFYVMVLGTLLCGGWIREMFLCRKTLKHHDTVFGKRELES